MKPRLFEKVGLILFLLGAMVVFTQCQTDASGLNREDFTGVMAGGGPGNGKWQRNATNGTKRGPAISVEDMCACLNANYPVEALTTAETDVLLFMREEEKLARDVYLELYKKWKVQVFDNISQSEQRHMDAIGCLITKYKLTDPVGKNAVGVFKNKDLKKLYDALIKEGNASLAAAYKAGAKIEDLDINDLTQAMAKADNKDILAVFTELTKASRNHLRAFNTNLERVGETYTPLYLSAEAFTAIVTGNHERGGAICGVCPNDGQRKNPGNCDGTGQGQGPRNGWRGGRN